MKGEMISFIGAGNITEAWVERLVRAGAIPADKIMVCDPANERLNRLKERYPGLNTTESNVEGASFGRIVVIATPPPMVAAALTQICTALQKNAIVVSLAAGVSLQKLAAAAPGINVLRIMPNTPSMVGEGMNLVCYAPETPDELRAEIDSLLAVFGKSMEISEQEMEAYGALCSVGPTFLFPIMQSLISSAVDAGLSEASARTATAQVVAGSARLVGESGRTVTELNGMIGIHTLPEPESMQMIGKAYKDALTKLQGLAAKMAAA